nr:hypothetical protein [Ornithinimicrobium flavum]
MGRQAGVEDATDTDQGRQVDGDVGGGRQTQARVGHRPGEQLVGTTCTAPAKLLHPQPPPQTSQADGVDPAQGPGQQLDRLGGGEDPPGTVDRARHHVEGQQQRHDGRVLAQHDPGAVDVHRHPAHRQRTAHEVLLPTAAGDHRQLPPGDPVQEVGPPQPPGDQARLLGSAARERHRGPATRTGRHRRAVRLGARHPDPRGDGGRHAGDLDAGAVPVPQHHGPPFRLFRQVGGLGPPPAAGEVDEEVGHRSAEALDGAVRVAQQHGWTSRWPGRVEQTGRRGGELVRVVHDDQAHPAVHLRPQRVVVLEGVGRSGADPGGVVAARIGQGGHLVVLLQDVGRAGPLGAFVPGGEAAQVVRLQTPLDGAHEEVPQLGAETPGGARRGEVLGPGGAGAVLLVPGEELAEHGVLLRPRDEARHRLPVAGGRQTQHREG